MTILGIIPQGIALLFEFEVAGGTAGNMRTLANAAGYAGEGFGTVIMTNTGTFGSNSTGTYGLRTGTFPAGVILRLVNPGRVQTKGGAGGAGGLSNGFGQPGLGGGHALLLENDLEIDNTSGEIFSGGGGGGGGNAVIITGGGGGGGGAGTGGGAGGIKGSFGATAGAPGTANAGGIGGAGDPPPFGLQQHGGNGGGPGLVGIDGNGVGGVGTGGNGGSPGNAINRNGFIYTDLVTGDIRGAIVG